MQGFNWVNFNLLGQYWLSFVVESVHDHFLEFCGLVFNILCLVSLQLDTEEI